MPDQVRHDNFCLCTLDDLWRAQKLSRIAQPGGDAVDRDVDAALERQNDGPEGEAWAVRLNGLDELLLVSRRQLAAVRELLLG